MVGFDLMGQHYLAMNGGPHCQLSPAVSISVSLSDQADIDRLWSALLQDGGVESRCGWLTDRWGLSWQILPDALPRLLAGDPSGRVMQAMMSMVKFDIAALEAVAAAQESSGPHSVCQCILSVSAGNTNSPAPYPATSPLCRCSSMATAFRIASGSRYICAPTIPSTLAQASVSAGLSPTTSDLRKLRAMTPRRSHMPRASGPLTTGSTICTTSVAPAII